MILFDVGCSLVSWWQWIWVAVDLANKEIQLYNSLNNSTNMRYLKMHLHTLVWLKYFLAWRLGEHNLLFLEIKGIIICLTRSITILQGLISAH